MIESITGEAKSDEFMIKKLIATFLFLNSFLIQAQLLDKISGVINGEFITLSDVQKISQQAQARHEIAPMIYSNANAGEKEIREAFFRQYIIRDKLSSYGYTITDDMVEERVVSIEKAQGVSRDDLRKFLSSKGLSYDDYFKLIRLSIEYSYFNSKVIAPLVAVSEQEIKNTFYKSIPEGKAIAFKYNIIDIIVPESAFKIYNHKQLLEILSNFRKGSSLPEGLRDITSHKLDEVQSESLGKELAQTLASTGEGEFSKAIKIDGQSHIFFIEKKDLVESDLFLREKDRIAQKIVMEKSKDIEQAWFDNEKVNYHIKTY